MRRSASYFLRLFALGIGLISLSGCFHLPTFTPTPTPTSSAPPATETPFPTAEIVPTETPSPAPSGEPKTVDVGKPAWIGHGGMVDAVFLPGNKQVAIAWGSGVSLDDVLSGNEIWFKPAPTNILAFDVQPQGKEFAAALADGSILLFDAAGIEDPRSIQGAAPDAEAGDVAWSPDGKTLAFQFIGPSRGDPIYLMDAATGSVSQTPHTNIDPGTTPSLAWSPDGTALTVATLGDTCPHVVDAYSGQPLMRPVASGQMFSSFPQLWLPSGKLLAVGSPDGGVALLRVPECNQARYLWSASRIDVVPNVKRSLFLDPNGKWLAARGGVQPYGYNDAQPYLVWNLTTDSVTSEMAKPLPALAQRRRIAAAFDGNNILTLYESGEITRWNFTDTYAAEQMVSQVRSMPVSQAGLVWSADGSRLAFTGSYGGVEVWDPAAGQQLLSFDAPQEMPAFSADGHKLALFDPVKKMETIYDVASGGALRTLDASPVLMGAAFSPDGHYLAYAAGGIPQVANLDATASLPLVPAHADGLAQGSVLTRLIWSPDSQSLVTTFGIPGSEGVGTGLVVLWQRNTRGAFIEMAYVANVHAGYQQPAPELAVFSPNGGLVALQSAIEIGANQLQLIIYDLDAHKSILTLDRYTLGVWVNNGTLLAKNPNSVLERINVITGDKQSGQGSGQVDAYAPGGIFTLQQSSSVPRGILILTWHDNPNTQLAERATFEAPGFQGDGWSPDGSWIWAAGTDGTAKIWPITAH